MRNSVQESPTDPPTDQNENQIPGMIRPNVWAVLKQSLRMLRPDLQRQNRTMFIVEIVAIAGLICIVLKALIHSAERSSAVSLASFISLDAWLFLTVMAANFVTAFAGAHRTNRR
jgi:K+-transporting ATPase ATPase B chain